jgi:lipopolysaccharide transport system permease protein
VATSETIIAPSSSWTALRLGELWTYRELLYALVAREVRVRYKQTAVGAAWAIIQPISTMIVFSVFFGRLAGIPSEGVPYPLFALCALVPWQLFAYTLTESSNSVVTNQRLITKVYFPRLMMPMSAVGVGLVDFAVAFAILVVMAAFYGVVPGITLLTIPIWTLLAVLTALAVGLWLSALNALYRDVRYTLPFITQLWLFATPVAYPSTLVPEGWRAWYALNPMVGVVDGFRWGLLGVGEPPVVTVAVSAVTVAGLLVGGLLFFRRMERIFADVV